MNQFALVIYIPDPLGRFLDDLRRELAPDCVPHAHVSVLPPQADFGGPGSRRPKRPARGRRVRTLRDRSRETWHCFRAPR